MQLRKKNDWRRLPPLIALAFLVVLIAGACWLISTVHEAREQARRAVAAFCFSNWPGGCEVHASGAPDTEVEQKLRYVLKCLADHAGDDPSGIGIRIRAYRLAGEQQELLEPLTLSEETLRPLRQIPKLRWLDFAEDNLVYGPERRSLRRGQKLDRSAFRLLGRLPTLECLDLRGTPTDDSALEQLSALTSLKRIDVCGTRVSGKGINRLHSTLPGCSILHD